MQRWMFVPVLLALLTISCLPAGGGLSGYIEKSFSVGPGEKYTVAAELKEGHTLEGSFSISGQENYIDFYVKDPLGGLAYGVVRDQGSHSFTLKAMRPGTHTLYFDNSFSWGTSRQIALRYSLR